MQKRLKNQKYPKGRFFNFHFNLHFHFEKVCSFLKMFNAPRSFKKIELTLDVQRIKKQK